MSRMNQAEFDAEKQRILAGVRSGLTDENEVNGDVLEIKRRLDKLKDSLTTLQLEVKNIAFDRDCALQENQLLRAENVALHYELGDDDFDGGEF